MDNPSHSYLQSHRVGNRNLNLVYRKFMNDQGLMCVALKALCHDMRGLLLNLNLVYREACTNVYGHRNKIVHILSCYRIV